MQSGLGRAASRVWSSGRRLWGKARAGVQAVRLPPFPRPPGSRWRVGPAAIALVGGLSLAAGLQQFTISAPGWVAAADNALQGAGLSAYRAVAFRREVEIPYTALTTTDPSLPAGLHEVRTPGEPGTAIQSGVAFYGASAAGAAAGGPRRGTVAAAGGGSVTAPTPAHVKLFAERVVRSPRSAVVAVGTSTDYVRVNGRYYHYSRTLEMTATAYNATAASNGAWAGQPSAIGLPLAYGVVAVDPTVIPLGTRLYVQSYGLAIAADTGSAIRGDRIDLFFWNSPAGIAAFGIRHLKVYVLDDPKLPAVPVPKGLPSGR